MFAPITRAMMEDTRIAPNQFVLDVAGGTGEPSLTIAREFGALVSIVSTDTVAEMVIAAKRESRCRGLTNVTFCQCAGEQLPFECQHRRERGPVLPVKEEATAPSAKRRYRNSIETFYHCCPK